MARSSLTEVEEFEEASTRVHWKAWQTQLCSYEGRWTEP